MSTEILRPKLPPLLRAKRFRKVKKLYLLTISGYVITVGGYAITTTR